MKLIINVIYSQFLSFKARTAGSKAFPANENLFDFQRVLKITQKQLEMLKNTKAPQPFPNNFKVTYVNNGC